ncbi:NUDIX domain-containing protein [Candidatus Woesearchaeota archaeon]|nr:NUDIX domain-containing protein [Candidatus Woesearchaeota archaeon]
MKRTTSAGGIVLRDNLVLVVNQHGRAWSLPKGHVEKDENPLQASQREIYEESGIKDLHFVKELGSYQRYKINKTGGDDTSELKTIMMFLFTTNEKILKPQDPDNPEARWVAKDKVARLLTHRKDKKFYQSVVDTLMIPNENKKSNVKKQFWNRFFIIKIIISVICLSIFAYFFIKYLY